jgi:hypothetical protein
VTGHENLNAALRAAAGRGVIQVKQDEQPQGIAGVDAGARDAATSDAEVAWAGPSAAAKDDDRGAPRGPRADADRLTEGEAMVVKTDENGVVTHWSGPDLTGRGGTIVHDPSLVGPAGTFRSRSDVIVFAGNAPRQVLQAPDRHLLAVEGQEPNRRLVLAQVVREIADDGE